MKDIIKKILIENFDDFEWVSDDNYIDGTSLKIGDKIIISTDSPINFIMNWLGVDHNDEIVGKIKDGTYMTVVMEVVGNTIYCLDGYYYTIREHTKLNKDFYPEFKYKLI